LTDWPHAQSKDKEDEDSEEEEAEAEVPVKARVPPRAKNVKALSAPAPAPTPNRGEELLLQHAMQLSLAPACEVFSVSAHPVPLAHHAHCKALILPCMFDTETKPVCGKETGYVSPFVVATSAQDSTPAAGIHFALPAGGRPFELVLTNASAVPEYAGDLTAETGYSLRSGGTCPDTRQACGQIRREALKVN
jgi:hypothetical protein